MDQQKFLLFGNSVFAGFLLGSGLYMVLFTGNIKYIILGVVTMVMGYFYAQWKLGDTLDIWKAKVLELINRR